MKKGNLQKIQEELCKVNEYYEGEYHLIIEFDEEKKFNKEARYYIVDDTENFYYDYDYGCFSYAFDKVTAIVKRYFGENSYIDCICPGRWIIDEGE